MPILHRTRRTHHTPARPAAAVQVSPMNRAWPVLVALVALVVFTVFMAQTTLLVALVMAMATLLAGGILLALMFGANWTTRLRRPVGRRH
jgi:uncharacterized RDD family membrane protein YckC